ncbi:MAG TPA: N-formylglutamate amidohydrolase [Polyangiales bacterium]
MGEPFEHEAYEELVGGPDAPAVLSCEHASPRLPEPYSWHEADRWLVGTHWSYDLGARELTLELARALSAGAVLSRYTRLLIDPNRSLDQPDLFRKSAEGKPVHLNTGLSDAERARRIQLYYDPFHAALDQALARSHAPLLFSIHSFTPNYEGVVRDVEVGVLFNKEEEHADALFEQLSRAFPAVRKNEPWSGRGGLIYSAESHAQRFKRVPLELEVRQDRLEDPSYRARMVPVLAQFIRQRFRA